jgi:hypothetical protein
LDVDTGQGPERRLLARGLTLVGGDEGDLPLPASGTDRLHVWDQPPKLMFVGVGEPPRVNGRTLEETELKNGDAIEWAGARLVFGTEAAALEELPLEQPGPRRPATAAAAGLPSDERVLWQRLHAGLLVELGMADKTAERRWQEAVVRGEFEPDAAARDLLANTQGPSGDPRLRERTARLMRDLVMAPAQRGLRGAGRSARRATRHGLAWLVSQLVVASIFFLMAVVALFVIRARWGWSVDAALDGIRDAFGGGG